MTRVQPEPVAVAAPRMRLDHLDAVRGLAILVMFADHFAVVTQMLTGHSDLLHSFRLTVGRAAMPLFFILAGYLARKLRTRHLAIGGIGLALPFAVPWIDSPNVLVWWAVGCAVLAMFREFRWSPVLLVVVGLVFGANVGYSGLAFGTSSFEPMCLLGLMGLGAMLRPTAWWWAYHLPARPALAFLGRFPVWLYVGHLLVLQVVVEVVR